MKLQHPYSDLTKEVPDDKADEWLKAGWVKAKAGDGEPEAPPENTRVSSRKKKETS